LYDSAHAVDNETYARLLQMEKPEYPNLMCGDDRVISISTAIVAADCASVVAQGENGVRRLRRSRRRRWRWRCRWLKSSPHIRL